MQNSSLNRSYKWTWPRLVLFPGQLAWKGCYTSPGREVKFLEDEIPNFLPSRSHLNSHFKSLPLLVKSVWIRILNALLFLVLGGVLKQTILPEMIIVSPTTSSIFHPLVNNLCWLWKLEHVYQGRRLNFQNSSKCCMLMTLVKNCYHISWVSLITSKYLLWGYFLDPTFWGSFTLIHTYIAGFRMKLGAVHWLHKVVLTLFRPVLILRMDR